MYAYKSPSVFHKVLVATLFGSAASCGSHVLAEPTVVAGPLDVTISGNARGSPVVLALVANSDRLDERENFHDLFQVVELPVDRDLAKAMPLLVIPDVAFHYIYPSPPMCRASAIAVDADHRYLCVVLSKAVGKSITVRFHAYSIAIEDDGRIRLEHLEDGPRIDDSSTVELPLFLTNGDKGRGPIRFIEMEAVDELVRVVMRIEEDDDSPVVYEVRTTDWSASRVSPRRAP